MQHVIMYTWAEPSSNCIIQVMLYAVILHSSDAAMQPELQPE